MTIQKKVFGMVCCFILAGAWMQISARPERFSPYYIQKKTLFDILPDEQGEIIFLGDSITDGGEWAEMFNDLRIKNRGISGDTTDGILARVDEVTAAKPAGVFLMIGINDLADGVPAETVLNNIKRIVQQIARQSPDTCVYIQSVLPVSDRYTLFPHHVSKGREIESVNAGLRAFCRNRGLAYIDLFALFRTKEGRLDPRYTNDGIHLTGAGYVLWMGALADYLR
ncbi:MAG: GDSL-type esterase/lipase family protein [Candidatus Aminicenantes bacterium]|nr:GDSL-type esterase/lipase family protein [Candidatus Aminicenantes bacterium]